MGKVKKSDPGGEKDFVSRNPRISERHKFLLDETKNVKRRVKRRMRWLWGFWAIGCAFFLFIVLIATGILHWPIQFPVTISDSALEFALRDALDKPEGPIYKSDLESLITLDLNRKNISDISALFGLTNLEYLELTGNPLSQNAINIHIPELETRGVHVRR